MNAVQDRSRALMANLLGGLGTDLGELRRLNPGMAGRIDGVAHRFGVELESLFGDIRATWEGVPEADA